LQLAFDPGVNLLVHNCEALQLTTSILPISTPWTSWLFI